MRFEYLHRWSLSGHNLFPCSTPHTRKECFPTFEWNFSFFDLCPLPLVTGQSLAPSLPSHHILAHIAEIPRTYSSPGGTAPPLSASLTTGAPVPSAPWWPFTGPTPVKSVSVSSWWAQHWSQRSRCGLASTEQREDLSPPAAGEVFPGAARGTVDLPCGVAGSVTSMSSWTRALLHNTGTTAGMEILPSHLQVRHLL